LVFDSIRRVVFSRLIICKIIIFEVFRIFLFSAYSLKISIRSNSLVYLSYFLVRPIVFTSRFLVSRIRVPGVLSIKCVRLVPWSYSEATWPSRGRFLVGS
jgi:hypothetical protein